jgi:hypothetical protein
MSAQSPMMIDRSRPWSFAAIGLALSSVVLGLSAIASVGHVPAERTLWWVLPLSALLAGILAMPAGLEGFGLARRLGRGGALAWAGLVAAVLPVAVMVIGTAVSIISFLGCRTGPI